MLVIPVRRGESARCTDMGAPVCIDDNRVTVLVCTAVRTVTVALFGLIIR